MCSANKSLFGGVQTLISHAEAANFYSQPEYYATRSALYE